ncbi:MAG: hypothetical protein R2715_19295 [Ilumatobacteraceae bacterium]
MPRTFEVAKSTVWACIRPMRARSIAGMPWVSDASVSSDEPRGFGACRCGEFEEGAKRSSIAIGPVGTKNRARVKALLPDCAVRVLTAIDARRWSTDAPSSS